MIKKLAFLIVTVVSLSCIYGQDIQGKPNYIPCICFTGIIGNSMIGDSVPKFPYLETKEMRKDTIKKPNSITGNLVVRNNLLFTNSMVETIDTIKVIAIISSTESLLVQSVPVLAVRLTKTMATLDGSGKPQTITTHIKYLNEQKGDLPKQIIVWLTKTFPK